MLSANDRDGQVDGGADDGEEEARKRGKEGEDNLEGEGEGIGGRSVVGCKRTKA